jgi:hypothetical protein
MCATRPHSQEIPIQEKLLGMAEKIGSMAAMRTALFVATSAILLQQAGCDQPKAPPKTPKITFPIHRFERPAAAPPDIALDTLTGQYCKTWEWLYKKSELAPSADLQTLPTCLELFNRYPSTQVDISAGLVPK